MFLFTAVLYLPVSAAIFSSCSPQTGRRERVVAQGVLGVVFLKWKLAVVTPMAAEVESVKGSCGTGDVTSSHVVTFSYPAT